jgi:CRISPR system Cascade subunit CasA
VNLADKPWIPCVLNTGETRDLSLADTLVRAHEIREIFDESPLVTVALHRLLLAIIHRNFGPNGRKAWFELWRRERWDESKLSRYFSRWRERFELFHPKHPFYQVPEMEGVARQPAAVMFQEMAAGNNTTLFDHSFEEAPLALSAARAARGLVARQAYSVGGGNSTPFNLSHSPLLRGVTVLVAGENLFQTLALNLIRFDEEHPFPRARREDLPIWEQERPATPRKEGSRPAGYLDYLTWQSRRIRLYPEEDRASVCFCQLQQNLKLAEDAPRDPFKCYRKDEKRGWIALPLREERALWRDSHTLMELSSQLHNRPAVFDWVAQLAGEPGASDAGVGPYFSFSAFGLATDIGKAASVTFWRHERLPLPIVYLSDPGPLGRLAEAIEYAEQVARDLRDSTWVLARAIFQPLDSASSQQERRDDANRLAQELAPLRFFWPELDAPFIQLMTDIAKIPSELREARLLEWRQRVRRIARNCFAQITRDFDTGGRALRAVAEGERFFMRKLREQLVGGEQL